MANKLKLLDLFSGIGGFSLGLERTGGFETVAFCEYDEKAQLVLKKHWPDVPIFKDVRDMNYEGSVDIISGGYPCQPFSVAGKQKGKEDDRHLWPAMFSLIKKHRPSWVIGENVAGHISLGLDDVLADLESEGYGARTFCIPACAVDAKHRRDRVWIIGERVVGNTKHDGSSSCGNIGELQGEPEWTQKTIFEFEGTSRPKHDEVMAHSNSNDWGGGDSAQPSGRKSRMEFGGSSERQSIQGATQNVGNPTELQSNEPEDDREISTQIRGETLKSGGASSADILSNPNSKRGCSRNSGWKDAEDVGEQSSRPAGLRGEFKAWDPEPKLGRVAHGIPNRVDRLKQLGNAVVPQIPEIIGNAILAVMKKNEES